MENTNIIIKVSSLKKLARIYSNQVKHFCKSSARLYGKIALREQLQYDGPVTIAQVEIDRADLQREIVQLANDCRSSVRRLNVMAEGQNIPLPLYEVDELGLTDFIDTIIEYVSRLVSESDFRGWQLEAQDANR